MAEAQLEADGLRDQYLLEMRSFSFETVMSHRSKIEILQNAKVRGFDLTVYFVATRDPEINVNRVERRVDLGGHDVPKDRIIARHFRTMELLPEAIEVADRAYLFDNSQYLDRMRSTGLRLAASVTTLENGQRQLEFFGLTPSWVSKATNRWIRQREIVWRTTQR